MDIKAVLFDMDGTLIDSELYYVEGTYEWVSRHGFKGERKGILSIIGTTLENTYKILSSYTDLSIEEIAKLNSDYFNRENPIDYARIIFPEVKDCLKVLKEMGYKLALCTSSHRIEISRFISKCQLENIFDATIGFEDIIHSKPNPEIYLKALDILGVKKEEALVVEDSKEGIMAGKSSGIYTLARKDERFGVDQSACDDYIGDLNDLIKLIRSNTNG